MKNLILLIALICTSSMASARDGMMTVRDNTVYPAKVVVKLGDLTVSQMALGGNTQGIFPIPYEFQISAATMINSQKITTAPVALDSTADFTATLKSSLDNVFTLNLEPTLREDLETISITNTLNGPVQFTISTKESQDVPSRDLQKFVLATSNPLVVKIPTELIYTVTAIVNGIKTETVTTRNPYAVFEITGSTDVVQQGVYKITEVQQ
jgi:hypothetical protein